MVAEYYYNNDEFDSALQYIEKYEAKEPKSPLASQMRALVFEKQNKEYDAHFNWGKYYLLKNAKDLQKEIEESMDTVLSVYTQRQKKKTFRFRGETVTLLLDQIMYIESKAHQLFFYLCDDTCRCMGKRTLDEMQRELTEDEGRFLRIHKSFLVNMNDISTLKRYQVQLFSGKQLPIPRERYAVVEMQYEEWKNRND